MSTGTGNPLEAHVADAGDDEYATPPEVWRPISRAVDGFDLDAASGAEADPIADDRLTADDDGLSTPWHGWTWINPPWSSDGTGASKHKWLRKARCETNRDAVDGIVMLLPADTSTHWWHDHVTTASAVCLVGPGRVAFEAPSASRNPSFSLAVLVWCEGDLPKTLVDALDSLGWVVKSLVDDNSQTTLDELSQTTLDEL